MRYILAQRPEHREWSAFVKTADETVQLANALAFDSSKNPHLRQLATRITRRCKRVDREGATAINQWIRRRMTYRRETVGCEVLQGPWSTLQTGVGDCDDLVILWATLCQSIGIRAYLVGVRKSGQESFAHAMGFAPSTSAIHELTDDRNYGGSCPSLVQLTLPKGYEAVGYDVTQRRYFELEGDGYPSSVMQRKPHHKRDVIMALAAFTFLYAVIS